jgi:hypothetical protein
VLAHAGVDDPRTIEWFARAVRDGAREVQSAGLGALARAMHPEALKALHKVYGKDKELRRDEELGVQLLKAIGAHESPESIELLAGDVFDGRAEPIVEARILALGRIRDRRSVEELVGIMKKGGRERVAPFMDELRLSLLVLTGADRGTSLEEWLAWWNDNKKTLEVRPEPAQLPERDWLRWARYWGFELRYERPTRREDRGDD